MEQFEKGLVSIIIPVFNREELLPETLDSILNQTYTKWECIIVDDGSTDASLQVAKDYALKDSRFTVYSRPWYKRKGANSCRNFGFKLSKGEFIQWFDSDDIIEFNFIEVTIDAMNKGNYEIGVVSAVYFEENIHKIISKNDLNNLQMGSNPAFEYFSLKFFFQTSQAIFRHSSLSIFGDLFDINLKRNQETQFFIRLLLKGFKFMPIRNTLVYIRTHSDSISSKYLLLTQPEKYLSDFAAYKNIYRNFKKSEFHTDDIRLHFSEYFIKSLKKAKTNSFIYINLFIFGIIEKLFPSVKEATKIFVSRFLKNV